LAISLAVLASVLSLEFLQAAETPALIQIERKNVDDLTVLRSAGIPVVLETSFSLFVLGGAGDRDALVKRGYDVKVLDRETAGADYLTVGVRPDTDMDMVREAGAVLFNEENWLLLRIPAGMDASIVADARAFVARLPEQPVAVPKARPASDSQSSVLVANPIVQKIVATVANADIQAYWNTLVTNPPSATRFSTTQGCRDAATYCFNAYTGLKLQAQKQNWSGTDAPNVIGTHLGATRPGDVYIIVAHLDDLPASGTAPGADDNGSGSASVLEAAKALSCWGVRNTVKFLNVTGEEQGLYGSTAYAADALTRGENILGVINYDMIGWAGDGIPAIENLDLNYNHSSQWLAQRFVDAAAAYGTGLSVDAILCPSLTVSDHYPFWQRGWSAICGITDNEGYCSHSGNYPPYHTSGDTIAANGNPAFFYKVVKTTVAALAELADPFKVTFGAAGYPCGAPIQVLVADRDMNTSAATAQSVAVHVWSASEPAGETMTLNERGINSMIFDGSMPTTGGPAVSGDGLLSVSAGDTLHVEYVDALDCDGASAVTYAATASVDCVAPIISGVNSSSVTGISATIGWTTDEAASSVVHYGTTPPGSTTAASSALVASHALGLTSLSECTNYSYWVESADGAGNTASDNAGGTYYSFSTVKNTTPSYASTGEPLAIPDFDETGATMTINVPDDKIVQDVNVRVNILHTFDGDLALSLIPPVGSPILLSNHRGGSDNHFTNTVFDDAAATPIASGTPPFPGSFIPDAPLSSANGIHSIGTWGLKAVDDAGSNLGTLQNWTLMLTYPSSPCAPPVPDGTFGAAMTSARGAADGSSINVTWDTSSCAAPGYKILYGPLSSVSTYVLGGSVCALGTGGTAAWSSVPAGDLWYVVVATDGAGTEGNWGTATAGPMGGATASAQCGDAARSNAGSCP
jgi:Zn-dependent M28 family amino/carboxypeptidase/subtilisin-like proprotein convertase family protein